MAYHNFTIEVCSADLNITCKAALDKSNIFGVCFVLKIQNEVDVGISNSSTPTVRCNIFG